MLVDVRKVLVAARSRLNHTGVKDLADGSSDAYFHDPKLDQFFKLTVIQVTDEEYVASTNPSTAVVRPHRRV